MFVFQKKKTTNTTTSYKAMSHQEAFVPGRDMFVFQTLCMISEKSKKCHTRRLLYQKSYKESLTQKYRLYHFENRQRHHLSMIKKHSRNTFFLLKKQNSVHHSETFKDKILPIMKKNSNQSHLPRQRHIAFCMAIVSNKALSLSLSLSLCPPRNKKKCPKPYATKHNKIIPKNMTTTNASYKTNVVQRVDDTSHGNVKQHSVHHVSQQRGPVRGHERHLHSKTLFLFSCI